MLSRLYCWLTVPSFVDQLSTMSDTQQEVEEAKADQAKADVVRSLFWKRETWNDETKRLEIEFATYWEGYEDTEWTWQTKESLGKGGDQLVRRFDETTRLREWTWDYLFDETWMPMNKALVQMVERISVNRCWKSISEVAYTDAVVDLDQMKWINKNPSSHAEFPIRRRLKPLEPLST